jgi:VIT1/CCC1 family predicted Fe2+/Mn2+ transporter
MTPAIKIESVLPRLRRSLMTSAGTIVFGMEDGTVSIFGLIFGVAATTSSSIAVLVAGASGAAAAAVSMMAGAYLDAETSRDERALSDARLKADLASPPSVIAGLLPKRLADAGLTPDLSAALVGVVDDNPQAQKGLLLALQANPEAPANPREQAFWMLLADFFSAAVPILPFVLLPIGPARFVSAGVTTALLIGLGIGRAKIAKRNLIKTVAETVAIGITAALAGVGIGVLIARGLPS